MRRVVAPGRAGTPLSEAGPPLVVERTADSEPAKPPPAKPSRLLPAKCGHALPADQGRKKHVRRTCSECIAKHREKEAKARVTRLPGGSRFVVDYDAATATWSGRLETTVDGEIRLFYGSASAVFHLLRKLDRAYRKAGGPSVESGEVEK